MSDQHVRIGQLSTARASGRLLAIGLGSGLLSYMLSKTDSFTAFLIFGGSLVLIGSLNLLRLGSIELANRQETKAA